MAISLASSTIFRWTLQAPRDPILRAVLLLACTVAVDGRSAGHLPAYTAPTSTESLGEELRQPGEEGLPSFVTRYEDENRDRHSDLATYLFSMTGCEYDRLHSNSSMEDKVNAAIKKTIAKHMQVQAADVNVVIEGGEAPQEAKAKEEEEKAEVADHNYTKSEEPESDVEAESEEGNSEGENSGVDDASEDVEAAAEVDDEPGMNSDLKESFVELSSASMYAVVTVYTPIGTPMMPVPVGLGNSLAAAIMNVSGMYNVTEGAKIVVSDPDVVTKGPTGEAGVQGVRGPPGPEGPRGEKGDHAEIKDFEDHPKGYAHPWMLGWAIVIHFLTLVLAYMKVKKELTKGRAEIQKLVQGGVPS